MGGETAEMPGFYPEDEYDLAGFTVGAVDKSKILDNSTMAPGDVIIALPSSGVHSNGFSLVRKVFDLENNPDNLFTRPAELGGKSLGEALLAPTCIYVKPVLAAEDADKTIEILKANGQDAYRLGVIAEGEGVELC